MRGGLAAAAILTLSRFLLHVLVRHQEPGVAVPQDNAEPGRRGGIPLVAQRTVRRRTMICVVLFHGRIEISISAGGRYRHAERALLASMLHNGVPAPSTEAAKRRGDRGAEASTCVRHRHNL